MNYYTIYNDDDFDGMNDDEMEMEEGEEGEEEEMEEMEDEDEEEEF